MKKQADMVTGVKIASELDRVKDRISELEDVSITISQTEVQRERERTEHLRTVSNYKRYNIRTIGITKGDGRQQGTEGIFEGILAENFLKLMTDPNPQVQEAERTPSRINPQTSAPGYTIFKVQKTKTKIKPQKKKKARGEIPTKGHFIMINRLG